jgi:hypothetical protein
MVDLLHSWGAALNCLLPDRMKLAAAGLKGRLISVSAIADKYANPRGAEWPHLRAKWTRLQG